MSSSTKQRTLMAVLKLKDQMSSGLKKVADNARKIIKEIDKVQDSFKNVGDNVGKINEPLQQVGATLAGVGGGAVVALTQYENSLLALQNQLGISKDEAKVFRGEMQKLAEQGYNLNDSIQSFIQVKRIFPNLSQGELNGVIKDVQILGQTFGAESQEIVSASQQMVASFGIDAQRAMDILGAGFQTGLDSQGEWLDVMREYSVQFADMGFNAEEMFTILKAGFNEGVFSIDKIGDGVKDFGLELIELDETGTKAIQALGLSVEEVYKAMEKGGEGAKKMSLQIADAISRVEDNDARDLLGQALFATHYEDIQEALVNAYSSVLNGVEEIGDVTGQMQKNFEETFGARLQGLINRMLPILERIGIALLPTLEMMADLAEKLADFLESIPEEDLQFFVKMGVIIFGVCGAFTVLATVINAVTTVLGAFSGVIALLTNPIGLVIAGVIALIGVLWKLSSIFKKSGEDAEKEFTNPLSKVIDFISDFTKNIIDNLDLQPIIDMVSNLLKPLLKVLKAIGDIIVFVFKTLFGAIKWVLESITGLFAKTNKENEESFSESFSSMEEAIWKFNDTANAVAKGFATNLVENITSGLQPIVDFISNLVETIKGLLENILPDFSNPIDTVKETFKTGWQEIMDAIKHSTDGAGAEIVKKFKTAGENVKEFWEQVKSSFDEPITGNVRATYAKANAQQEPVTTKRRSAFGTRRVVGDDVPYRLHDGEMILTAREARNYKDNNYGLGKVQQVPKEENSQPINNISINISNMQVREEADINKVAEQIVAKLMNCKGVVV